MANIKLKNFQYFGHLWLNRTFYRKMFWTKVVNDFISYKLLVQSFRLSLIDTEIIGKKCLGPNLELGALIWGLSKK